MWESETFCCLCFTFVFHSTFDEVVRIYEQMRFKLSSAQQQWMASVVIACQTSSKCIHLCTMMRRHHLEREEIKCIGCILIDRTRTHIHLSVSILTFCMLSKVYEINERKPPRIPSLPPHNLYNMKPMRWICTQYQSNIAWHYCPIWLNK